MSKQLHFDECLMQNAIFRARHMILSILEITKNLAEHSCSAFFECPHGPQWSHFGRRAGRTRSNMSAFEHHSQSKTWFESCCILVRMDLGLHLVPPCARTLFSTLCSGPCATLPCAKRGGGGRTTGRHKVRIKTGRHITIVQGFRKGSQTLLLLLHKHSSENPPIHLYTRELQTHQKT